MSTAATKLITAEEFCQMPNPADGSRQELVRGEIVTMPPPGFRHGASQLKVGVVLYSYVQEHKLGHVTTNSGAITERDPDTVRGPDVAFWSKEDLPLDQMPAGYPDVSPRLCVEVLSPDKRLKKVREKLKEYFASGVKIVWVIDPEKRTVDVYRSPDDHRVFQETETISIDDVLPGFTCQVSELLP